VLPSQNDWNLPRINDFLKYEAQALKRFVSIVENLQVTHVSNADVFDIPIGPKTVRFEIERCFSDSSGTETGPWTIRTRKIEWDP
jgi:hypothetical protein